MPTLPTGTHAQLRGTQQLNVNELVKECSNPINSLNFSSGSHYVVFLKIQRLHRAEEPRFPPLRSPERPVRPPRTPGLHPAPQSPGVQEQC